MARPTTLLVFASIGVLLATASSGGAAADIDRRLAEIHARAKQAQAEARFDEVESLRRQRLRLLTEAARAEAGESPWTVGAAALADADRHVDALRYREAVDVLRSAWATCLASPAGEPIFGDVAVRMFEVGQQALAVHSGALTKGDPAQVATPEELQGALAAALERDPCQVEAHAMLAFLTVIDPREAFLRAEVRPTIKARNAALVNLSRPVDATSPIMPWHAPVEMLKAGNSLAILQDLVPVDRFLGFPGQGGVPGVGRDLVMRGFDANKAPFRFDLLERFFLMEVPDAKGVARPALVTLVDGEWRKRNIRILWRKTAGGGNSGRQPGDAGDDELIGLLNDLVPFETWKGGADEFAIYDLPVDRAGRLIGRLAWLTVANVDAVMPRVKGERAPPLADQVNWFETDLRVLEALDRLPRGGGNRGEEGKGDPVAKLLEEPGLNPLLVYSSDSDTSTARPAFIGADGPEPHLLLDDGTRLDVRAEAGELIVQFPVASGHLPLTIQSIPKPLFTATNAGRVLRDLLLRAGYDEQDFMAQINLADRGYVPAKFETYLKKVARQRRQNPEQAFVEMMREVGWERPDAPVDDLRSRFFRYGFRHLRLRDARGSVIVHVDLLRDGAAGGVDNQLVYDMRSMDGQQVISTENLYTAQDYLGLYDNVRAVFFPQMFEFHPSVPTWALVNAFDAEPPPRSLSGTIATTGSASLRPAAVDSCPPWEEVDETLRQLVNRLTGEYLAEVQTLRQAGGSQPRVAEAGQVAGIFRMQHAAARNLAREGHYHRSIVFFNDIVRGLQRAQPLDTSLFGQVPNPDQLAEFGRRFAELVESQRFTIIVQAEQAAVLRAAGLEESADFLWRSIVDQYRLYTMPMLDIAADYGRSYGFAMPASVTRARADIERYVAVIEQAAGARTRRVDPTAAVAGDARAAAILAEIEPALASELDRPAEAAKLVKSIDATLSELLGLRRSLGVWVREKRLLATRAPGYLFRSPHHILSPARVVPAAGYDAERGFVTEARDLFDDSVEERLKAQLAATGKPAADAGILLFLLGWYWLDQGEFSRAKAEFTAAAQAYLTAAGDETERGLVARRNALIMLVAAGAITEAPPGVDSSKTDFLDGLEVQAKAWQRVWFARGLAATHAEKQEQLVASYLRQMRQRLGQARATAWDRYFFVDYRFRFGAIPDVVLADAIRMRLFESVPRDEGMVPVDTPAEPAAASGSPLEFPEFLRRVYPPPQDIDETILGLRAG